MSKKQCTVTIRGRRCTNQALPGRRTCGKHGKKVASRSSGRRQHFIHLDCNIPMLPSEEPRKLDFGYHYPVVVRDLERGLIQVSALPTNERELGAFIAAWLNMPGHRVSDVERLTPPAITVWPDQFSSAALNLIMHDSPPAPGFRMEFGASTMFAHAVPTGGQREHL